jgi:hypothetical protein
MRHNHRSIAIVFVSILAALLLFGSIGLQALAQDGGDSPDATPGPDEGEMRVPSRANPDYYDVPAETTGEAEWTLAERMFTSNYPDGFEFTVQASSSAGDIENATVIWSHAPGYSRRQAAEYDEENERFVVNWEGGGVVPWVAVNYRWLLTDEEGNTYQSEWFTGQEYEDTIYSWTRLESEDMIVFVQDGLPEDTARLTIDAMAAQRDIYRQAWGGLLPYKPRAILFATRAAWNEWQRGATNPAVIGTTRPEWGAVVQVVSGGDTVDLAYGTVLHEMAHLYQSVFAPVAFGNVDWFNEGNATFFELSQQYDYEQRVRNGAQDGILSNVLQGTGPSIRGRGPDGVTRWGYDVGYTFWRWVVDTYGLQAHRQIISQIGIESAGRNEVLEEVLGMSITEIESEWREWLGASGTVPTLVTIPTMRIPPTVTPFIFPTKDPDSE